MSLRLGGDGAVTHCAIALGGIATKPWRAVVAEAGMIGRPVTPETALAAGRTALAAADPIPDQRFKVALAARVVAKALLNAGA